METYKIYVDGKLVARIDGASTYHVLDKFLTENNIEKSRIKIVKVTYQ